MTLHLQTRFFIGGLEGCSTDGEQPSSLSLTGFFCSRVVFLCFHPCLVSVLFTGPSLLVVNIYRKFFTYSVFSNDQGTFLLSMVQRLTMDSMYLTSVMRHVIASYLSSYVTNTHKLCSVHTQCLAQPLIMNQAFFLKKHTLKHQNTLRERTKIMLYIEKKSITGNNHKRQNFTRDIKAYE